VLDTTVMHRIVAIDGERYVFKGDNNTFLDLEHPRRSQLIGTLALRVPQGGVWLHRLTSPAVLAGACFALLIGGGTAVSNRRRRRRSKAMYQPRRRRPSPALSTIQWSPLLVAAATGAAVLTALGMLIALLAWRAPLQGPSVTGQSSGPSVTFSYSAPVPRTAAYDGDTARSPDPIFRQVTNHVAVHLDFAGAPGRVSVAGELSTASGWHTAIPLLPPTSFTQDRYRTTVSLDLNSLDARARAAAEVIGIPYDQGALAITATVDTTDGQRFAPTLQLLLTPRQLRLAAGPSALTVQSAAATGHTISTPSVVDFMGHQVTIRTARIGSVVLLLCALLAGAATIGTVRRLAPANDAAAIRRRYRNLLVATQPFPFPEHTPVADVTDFASLVKLAERYGLLIAHWSEGGVETFVLHDEATIYRYLADTHPIREARSHDVGQSTGGQG
jgi:hypothetical protein